MRSNGVLSLFCLPFVKWQLELGVTRETSRRRHRRHPSRVSAHTEIPLCIGTHSWIVMFQEENQHPPQQHTVDVMLYIDSSVICRYNRCPLSLLLKFAKVGFQPPIDRTHSWRFSFQNVHDVAGDTQPFWHTRIICFYIHTYVHMVTDAHALYGSITLLVTTEP